MSGATSRRRFLQNLAGLSLGATSLGALAACRGPAARPASKRLPLMGYFAPGTEQADRANTAAVLDGLAALGYRDGQTITIERRYGNNEQSQRAAIAQELVDLRPAVIVLWGPLVPSLLALTRTIPIVAVLPQAGARQMIASGVIQSQARPGGNLTGLFGGAPSLFGKLLDLLHEAMPAATRLATLRDSSFPDPYLPYPGWTSHVTSVGISGPEELDDAFARFETEQAELLAVAGGGGGSRLTAFLDQVAEQARRHHLPAAGDSDSFALSGGLLSYAADALALFRGSGRFVDKILKGANPAELPVEEPTSFKFIINKGTATALGLTIPPALLAQATEVLQ